MPKNAYKTNEEKRVQTVHIKLTHDEYNKVAEIAKQKGLSKSQYVRFKVFGTVWDYD